MKSFEREITTVKRKITKEQKMVVLNILKRMVYSESSSHYEDLFKQLMDLKLDEVTDYFVNNWHNIRDEWTLFGTNNYLNFLNRTSNRLESFNQKIKLDSNCYANLVIFFQNLMTTINCHESEKDSKVIKMNMRQTLVSENDEVLDKYKNILTNFSFVKLVTEYREFKSMIINDDDCQIIDEIMITVLKNKTCHTTQSECNCGFNKTILLPCRHIFKFLSIHNKNLFDESLVAKRSFL